MVTALKIKSHKLLNVDFIPSPNIGGALAPQGIILHDTASPPTPSGDIAWLTDKQSRVSAHVLIARDGKITQLVPFNRVAWHAGASQWKGLSGLNSFTIGIELDNPARLQSDMDGYICFGKRLSEVDAKTVVYSEAFTHPAGYYLPHTPEQLSSALSLCLALRDTYGIEWLATHWQISPGRKVDPNPTFPLEQFTAKVFPQDSDTSVWYTVNVGSLNVRSGPGASFEKIGEVAVRTHLSPKQVQYNGPDAWGLVDFGDTPKRSGWVAMRYLEEV